MKANAAQLRAALDAPGPVRLFLLYGPDEAGAHAQCRRLAAALGAEAERIDLDGATLKSDPGRLASEAAALSLFGGARWVRVTEAGEEVAEAAALLLAAPAAGNPVVIIAPGVKAAGKLAKLATDHKAALAFACYPPSADEAERLIPEMAGALGLRLASRVAGRLFAAAAGDRAVIERELEKLALYLDAEPGRPATVQIETLDAIGADLGDAEIGTAILLALGGDGATLGAELARLEAANVSPIPLLRGLVKRLVSLAEMRLDVARGSDPAAVVKAHRVFFKEEALILRALRRFSSEDLARAIDALRAAERALISPANAGDVLGAAALLRFARAVRR